MIWDVVWMRGGGWVGCGLLGQGRVAWGRGWAAKGAHEGPQLRHTNEIADRCILVWVGLVVGSRVKGAWELWGGMGKSVCV